MEDALPAQNDLLTKLNTRVKSSERACEDFKRDSKQKYGPVPRQQKTRVQRTKFLFFQNKKSNFE